MVVLGILIKHLIDYLKGLEEGSAVVRGVFFPPKE
jgi:hypothetical protein